MTASRPQPQSLTSYRLLRLFAFIRVNSQFKTRTEMMTSLSPMISQIHQPTVASRLLIQSPQSLPPGPAGICTTESYLFFAGAKAVKRPTWVRGRLNQQPVGGAQSEPQTVRFRPIYGVVVAPR